MTRTLLLALGATMMVGCTGEDTDETDTAVSCDVDPYQADCPMDCEADPNDPRCPPEITISGSTREVFSAAPAGTAHCVDAVDPSAALEGGALNVLGTTTVNADGSYAVTGVDVSQAPLAIFLILRDCDNSGSTVFPSATGFASESYSDATYGDELTSTVLYVGAATAAGLDASLAAIQSDARLADGSVMGFVFDTDGSPLGGATVTCAGCGPTYYVDTVADDGLLSTFNGEGVAINTATTPGVGLAFIPSGPVAAYQATADGKTFEAGLFGSLPGIAAFTAWTAQ